MIKIETSVRTAPFLLRVLILLTGMLVIFMFVFNPAIHGSDKDETTFQLIFISTIILLIFFTYLYFKIPRVPVTLMMLDDKDLSFRTKRNPAFGIGQDYQEEFVINTDDILYIYPYMQYIHQVGSFFCITFYCNEAGVFPTYYDTEQKDKFLKLLDNILSTNKNIKLINDRGFALANFPAMEERMIQEIPDGYCPDGSSRRLLFSEKFSKDEWQTLLQSPFQVFSAVAGADSNIDKWESRTLISTLKSASQQRSFLVADLLGDAIKDFDHLLTISSSGFKEDIKQVLSQAVNLVDREGDEIDRHDFRTMMISFAQSIAESSGLGNQRVSEQEKMVLYTIENTLRKI